MRQKANARGKPQSVCYTSMRTPCTATQLARRKSPLSLPIIDAFLLSSPHMRGRRRRGSVVYGVIISHYDKLRWEEERGEG